MKMSKRTLAITLAITLSSGAASAMTIERAGGIKVVGEPSWVAAVTVCERNQSDCFKITTENHAKGRALEVGDAFERMVVAPAGAFDIGNPYSVVDYVKSEFGAGVVEIIKNNGEDDKDHW